MRKKTKSPHRPRSRKSLGQVFNLRRTLVLVSALGCILIAALAIVKNRLSAGADADLYSSGQIQIEPDEFSIEVGSKTYLGLSILPPKGTRSISFNLTGLTDAEVVFNANPALSWAVSEESGLITVAVDDDRPIKRQIGWFEISGTQEKKLSIAVDKESIRLNGYPAEQRFIVEPETAFLSIVASDATQNQSSPPAATPAPSLQESGAVEGAFSAAADSINFMPDNLAGSKLTVEEGAILSVGVIVMLLVIAVIFIHLVKKTIVEIDSDTGNDFAGGWLGEHPVGYQFSSKFVPVRVVSKEPEDNKVNLTLEVANGLGTALHNSVLRVPLPSRFEADLESTKIDGEPAEATLDRSTLLVNLGILGINSKRVIKLKLHPSQIKGLEKINVS